MERLGEFSKLQNPFCSNLWPPPPALQSPEIKDDVLKTLTTPLSLDTLAIALIIHNNAKNTWRSTVIKIMIWYHQSAITIRVAKAISSSVKEKTKNNIIRVSKYPEEKVKPPNVDDQKKTNSSRIWENTVEVVREEPDSRRVEEEEKGKMVINKEGIQQVSNYDEDYYFYDCYDQWEED